MNLVKIRSKKYGMLGRLNELLRLIILRLIAGLFYAPLLENEFRNNYKRLLALWVGIWRKLI